MKILLADDHTLFRDSLVEYIRRADSSTSVLTASDMNEVMEIIENGYDDIDIILLDLRMPGMDDFRGLKKLTESDIDVPVALLSGLAEKEDVKEALRIGAAGYFSKTLSGKAMLNGIKAIINGEEFISIDHNTNEIMPSYYPSEAKDNATNNASRGVGAGTEDGENIHLTPRENDVLLYLAEGATNKDIARALDLQIVTVKLHVRGICRKLDAKNRTQAVLRAQQEGLVKKG